MSLKFSTAEKKLLFTLAFIQFIHIVDFMILMPLGPQLMRLFNITPGQFSLMVSIYSFAAGAMALASAFFLDRFDRKKALLSFFGLFIAGTFACALSQNFQILVFARAFTGLFGGVLSALVLSIIGDSIPPERRATAMGVQMAAFSAASVLGVPLGLFIAAHTHWQVPFLSLGALGVFLWIFCFVSLPSMTQHMQNQNRPSPLASFGELMKTPNTFWALGLMLLMMLGQFTVIPFLSPYMVANVGFKDVDLTWIYLCGGAATLFTGPWIGKIADQYGKLRIFRWVTLLSLPALCIVPQIPVVPVYVAILCTTYFMITVSGRMSPAMAMITGSVEPQKRGSFMSLNSCVQQLSAGLGAFLAGLVIVKNPQTGHLENFEYVGYTAILFSLLAFWIAGKVKAKS